MQAKSKPRKEALYVRVVAPDETVDFHDVTDHIGKAMPFASPRATLAMRVTEQAVVFSLLHLTKRAATGLVEKPVELPRGPLARLERHAVDNAVSDIDTLVVEIGEQKYTFRVERDPNGTVELVGDDGSIELPRAALQMTLHLGSSSAKRPIVVGFIGHVGKPGAMDTIRRSAAMVLNSITQLPAFRVITEIQTVKVPAAPRSIARPTRRADERAQVLIPVRFFDDEATPGLVASGSVHVEVDLEDSNPTTGRLLYRFTADKATEAVFDQYRIMLDLAVTQKMMTVLGADELKSISTDIVLGEVATGTVERLQAALVNLEIGIDATPTQFRFQG